MKITLTFADDSDFSSFVKWLDKSKAESGTPAPLWNALASSAAKRAKIKIHKTKATHEN